MTADGERVADPATVLPAVVSLATDGLVRVGCSRGEARELLAPVRARAETRTAPSVWKRERARAALDDGAPLDEAVVAAQRAYLDRAASDEPFAAWD
ncbi:hypothetical protein ACFQRB_00635 [Halobaculum litoreum]|uniref:Uncharacterized protein n=1 Tax=Halobaculum litoreum TaxID=3031998 RepID=A0ABD5XR19_9EURY